MPKVAVLKTYEEVMNEHQYHAIFGLDGEIESFRFFVYYIPRSILGREFNVLTVYWWPDGSISDVIVLCDEYSGKIPVSVIKEIYDDSERRKPMYEKIEEGYYNVPSRPVKDDFIDTTAVDLEMAQITEYLTSKGVSQKHIDTPKIKKELVKKHFNEAGYMEALKHFTDECFKKKEEFVSDLEKDFGTDKLPKEIRDALYNIAYNIAYENGHAGYLEIYNSYSDLSDLIGTIQKHVKNQE